MKDTKSLFVSQLNSALTIKNMVCQRCVLTLTGILDMLKLPYDEVSPGNVKLPRILTDDEMNLLQEELMKVGFDLIGTRLGQIMARIKVLVLDFLNQEPDRRIQNLSAFITDAIPYDYSYLSDLFSSIEGRTIEQYFILSRIEKVKELLVYDQQSLSEIADQVGYSSVHHLSAQFKKITGLTPSHFRKIGKTKRISLDDL